MDVPLPRVRRRMVRGRAAGGLPGVRLDERDWNAVTAHAGATVSLLERAAETARGRSELRPLLSASNAPDRSETAPRATCHKVPYGRCGCRGLK